jgi:hypothetical protein
MSGRERQAPLSGITAPPGHDVAGSAADLLTQATSGTLVASSSLIRFMPRSASAGTLRPISAAFFMSTGPQVVQPEPKNPQPFVERMLLVARASFRWQSLTVQRQTPSSPFAAELPPGSKVHEKYEGGIAAAL